MTNPTGSTAPAWRTSSYSGGGNQCVEVAAAGGGRVAVRDSKDPAAGVRVFGPAAWARFTDSVKRSGV